MKLLKRLGLPILVLLFLSVDLCYGQTADYVTAQELIRKGEEYGSQGKFKEAKEAFEKSCELYPYFGYDPDPLYFGSQHHLRIIEYLEQQKIEPNLAVNYFKAICEYPFWGQREQAISQYNSNVIVLNTEDAGIYFIRGHIYGYFNLSDNAISDYTKAIELDPNFYDAYLRRASLFEQKGQYDKAISDYNKAIEIDPEYAEAYSNRGSFYRRQYHYNIKGRYDRAISDYNKAIELNPEHPEYYCLRGDAYMAKQEYDNAISDYNKAIELKPDYYDAYINRGFLYYLRRQYHNLISNYSKLIEIYPYSCYSYKPSNYRYIRNIDISYLKKAIEIDLNNAGEYFTRGWWSYNLDQYDDAIPDFNKAIELNQEFYLYYEFRGSTYTELEKFDKAIADYNKAIELKPEKAIYYFLRGKAYSGNHQYDDAISDYSTAIELNPALSCIYYESRGDAYADIGKYEEAIADYNKGAAECSKGWIWFDYYYPGGGHGESFSDYDNGVVFEKRADIYAKIGKYEKAIADYSIIIETNPPRDDFRFVDIAIIYNKRGDAYDEIGNLEKACADWEKACSFGLGYCDGWSIINRIRCIGK